MYIRNKNLIKLSYMFLPCFLSFSSFGRTALAKGSLSEIILEFKETKFFHVKENKDENLIILSFEETSLADLSSLQNYDEKIIKKVVFKELNGNSEAFIYLRDSLTKVNISDFTDPFRISLSFFSDNYDFDRDPQTKLPFASLWENDSESESTHNNSNFGLVKSIVPPEENINKNSSKVLLQPAETNSQNSSDLENTLKATPSGKGKSWDTFPFYIYPVQTASFQKNDGSLEISKDKLEANLKDSPVLADQAFNFFMMGDENKALAIYEQVLHQDSSLFDTRPLHLWSLAEIHLGQGNLTLAKGYYQSLQTKFPGSPLFIFATLRQLDIKALESLKVKNYGEIKSLAEELKKLEKSNNPEENAQIEIRSLFWNQIDEKNSSNFLPLSDENTEKNLTQFISHVESGKTSFILSSLILKSKIKNKKEWSLEDIENSRLYFEKYGNAEKNIFYEELQKILNEKISETLIAYAQTKNYADTIRVFESFHKILPDIEKNTKISWVIAEAYRITDQKTKAVPFYLMTTLSLDKKERFKALLFTSKTSSEAFEENNTQNKKSDAKKMENESKKSDEQMLESWNELTPEEKREAYTTYKNDLESALNSAVKIATPAKIILQQWTAATSEEDAQKKQEAKTLKTSDISLLIRLSHRLEELELKKESRNALMLLKNVGPDSFKDDTQLKTVWVKKLLDLAEEFRKEDEFLEGGRLFVLVAEKAGDWENKAEALYKGGLLLYRAGRREEATKALTEASKDPNNLYYANLAKERVTQLGK